MSLFWDNLSTFHSQQLEDGGIGNFRQTVARRYFTDERLENEGSVIQLYNKITELGVVVDIDDSTVGNGFLVKHNDHLISQDLLISLYEVHSMVIDFTKVKHVIEVGAGYGRTAYVLLKKYPHLKYTILDREPAMTVSKYFLTSEFPNAYISWNPKKLAKHDVGLAISVMTELTQDEIDKYFMLFGKGKYLYLKDWDVFSNSYDKTVIDKNSYPIPDTWKCTFMRKDPLTKDFFEALYEIS